MCRISCSNAKVIWRCRISDSRTRATVVTSTRRLDLCRSITGGPCIPGALILAYLCNQCSHLPVEDFSWYVVPNEKSGDEWWCPLCGCLYTGGERNTLFGIKYMGDDHSLALWYTGDHAGARLRESPLGLLSWQLTGQHPHPN